MLLLEPLGVGKTHLVEALGMNICRPAFGRWDEIIPIDWQEPNLFFQLVSRRYEGG